jgi:lipopolysaccharide export system protein LptA
MKYKNIGWSVKTPTMKVVYITILFIILTKISLGQDPESTPVDILNSDVLFIQNIGGEDIKKLVGHVKLQQGDAIMNCDSAIILPNNDVDAQGHILINKGASVKLSGNFLYYNSISKSALVRGNVKLTDGKMVLATSEIYYDLTPDIGYYTSGGVVTSEDTKIKSQRGTYYATTKDVFFKGNVKVTNPKYTLTSDTLKYNMQSKFVTFYGSTKIFNDSSTILCDNGWYDSKQNIASFGVGTIIYSGAQKLDADSLYYLRTTGYGQVFKRYTFIDTAMKAEMTGTYAQYYDKEKKVIGYNRPLMTSYDDKEAPLYIRAEILKTEQPNGVKAFYGYKKVRIYKKDFQAVCDTMIYNYADSVFRLYRNPTIWNDSSQLLGDTVFLETSNRKPKLAHLLQNGFVSEHLEKTLYNQMKGDVINIYFKNGKTEKLHTIENAESKYYGKEEGKGYQGINSAKSREIISYFEDGKIQRIQFIYKPEAVFTPMQKITNELYFIKGFRWKESERPRGKGDL